MEKETKLIFLGMCILIGVVLLPIIWYFKEIAFYFQTTWNADINEINAQGLWDEIIIYIIVAIGILISLWLIIIYGAELSYKKENQCAKCRKPLDQNRYPISLSRSICEECYKEMIEKKIEKPMVKN